MAVNIAKKKQEVVQKVGVESVGTVEKKHKDGSTEEYKEVVKSEVLDDPHATVGVSVSITKNLGNYESLKATVTLFLPCKADGDEIEATYFEARQWVDGKINEINEEIENS